MLELGAFGNSSSAPGQRGHNNLCSLHGFPNGCSHNILSAFRGARSQGIVHTSEVSDRHAVRRMKALRERKVFGLYSVAPARTAWSQASGHVSGTLAPTPQQNWTAALAVPATIKPCPIRNPGFAAPTPSFPPGSAPSFMRSNSPARTWTRPAAPGRRSVLRPPRRRSPTGLPSAA